MKKSFLGLMGVISCLFSCAFFPSAKTLPRFSEKVSLLSAKAAYNKLDPEIRYFTIDGKKDIYATEDLKSTEETEIRDSEIENSSKKDYHTICVIGYARTTADADAVILRMGLQLRAESVSIGNTKLTEQYEKIVAAIRAVDDEAGQSATQSCFCVYPVGERGISEFELSKEFQIKLKNIDRTSDIIAAAGEAGITGVYSQEYILEDNSASLNAALNASKVDAQQKAAALCENPVLISLSECNVCCYSSSDCAGKIMIEASVRACYRF